MKFALQIGRLNFRIGFDRPAATRSYNAAAINRLTADWATFVTSADVEARNDVTKLRSRCRELERDDPYARRYFKLLTNNVLGWQNVRLQMQCKNPAGDLDSEANKQIEEAWERFGKKKNCTATRSLSWHRVCALALTSASRDGGHLIHKVRGFNNDFRWTLSLKEVDHLDVYYNVPNFQGNEIRMGVEVNEWREPVAYYLWTKHPGDYNASTAFKRERVLAKDIIHLYLPERAEQTIGVPWITSAMSRLNILNGYEEAELTAARAAACKEGYIENEAPEEFKGDGYDADGNQIQEMEPGVVRTLLPGQHFVEHDPKHPNSSYGPFVKTTLRGASSGMGVSYNSLANDLEGVNYSSIRAGVLEDREEYKMMQQWFIEDLCEEVFQAWLPFAILSGELKLPLAKLDKWRASSWQARRWAWVDPLKDINAAVIAIQNRLQSRTGAVADQGGDFEDLLDQIEEEERLAKDKHVDLPIVEPPMAKIEPEEEEPAAGAPKEPDEEPAQAASKKKPKK